MRPTHSRITTRWMFAGVLALVFLSLVQDTSFTRLAAAPDESALVTLSIVGTSDLHGAAFERNGIGGLPLLAGYVNNLRASRASDGGAVLLIDSGDTFQGTVESNLSEGALIVDAYNAMGYTAEAVGNHDFDFGAADSATARELPGDLRGALQARAAQARYPFLAANLIDEGTGRPVAWPNVRPSVIVETAGVKVGILGVMTIDALRFTLIANVRGLRIAPLEPTIESEAAKLRAAGAEVVVVASHAGGYCERFDRPADLSSCDAESEIFQVARSLPPGLVDVIAAGHTHSGLAQHVNGIGIIEPFSHGQAFGRVDVMFDRVSRRVARIEPFAPRQICAQQHAVSGSCVPATEAGVPIDYEGRTVAADPRIVDAMAPALEHVRALQATTLGGALETAVRRVGDVESPLGHLFAAALRDAVRGADIAVINNAGRGLRADLPAGPITFGRVYDVFPFDNRIARMTLSAVELSRWLATEIRQGRRGGLGIAGVELQASCVDDSIHVDLLRGGERIDDQERLVVVAIGPPTPSGGVMAAVPSPGVWPMENAPVVRHVIEDWFRRPEPVQNLPDTHRNQGPEHSDAKTVGCPALNDGRGPATAGSPR